MTHMICWPFSLVLLCLWDFNFHFVGVCCVASVDLLIAIIQNKEWLLLFIKIIEMKAPKRKSLLADSITSLPWNVFHSCITLCTHIIFFSIKCWLFLLDFVFFFYNKRKKLKRLMKMEHRLITYDVSCTVFFFVRVIIVHCVTLSHPHWFNADIVFFFLLLLLFLLVYWETYLLVLALNFFSCVFRGCNFSLYFLLFKFLREVIKQSKLNINSNNTYI